MIDKSHPVILTPIMMNKFIENDLKPPPTTVVTRWLLSLVLPVINYVDDEKGADEKGDDDKRDNDKRDNDKVDDDKDDDDEKYDRRQDRTWGHQHFGRCHHWLRWQN